MFSVEQLVANCLFNSLVDVRCYYNDPPEKDMRYHGSPFKDLKVYRHRDDTAPLWFIKDPIFEIRISEHLSDVSFNTGNDLALLRLYWAYVYFRDNLTYKNYRGDEDLPYLPTVVTDCYPSTENPLPACFPAPSGYTDDYFTWNAIALLVMWAFGGVDSPSGGSEDVRQVFRSLVNQVVTPDMMIAAQNRAISLES